MSKKVLDIRKSRAMIKKKHQAGGKQMKNYRKVKLGSTMGIFFAVFLILQIALLVMYEAFSIDIAKKNEKNLVENTLQIYHNTLESVLERLDDNLSSILGYRLELNLLETEEGLEKVKAQHQLLKVLRDRCDETEEADAYVIVDCTGNSILMQRNGNVSYDKIRDIKKYFQKRNMEDEKATSGWISTTIQDQVYLVKYYNYGNNTIAVLLSEKKLASLLNYNDASDENARFYLTDTSGKVLCGSGEEWRYGENIENLRKQNPRTSFYQGSTLEDAYQMYYRVESSVYVSYSTMGIIILGFLLLSVIFFMVIVWYMQKEVLSPISNLSQVSRKIHNGDFNARAEYHSNSYEMDEVKDTYNNMVQTILKMRVEQYEHELAMKDVQLKYMHMQLKPHFFLNALSTINSMAYQQEEENIHTFIQAFSQNIRYMFRTGLHTVPLIDEIKNVEGYVEMQQLMYRDCFYVYMNIPEELQQYQVPQMILHTFLENVFKHVISIDSFTTVLIQALTEEEPGEEERLKIEIHTSQKHFSEETLEMINGEETGPERKDGTGIGIRNVKEVLRIMYQQEHLLYLENLDSDGTKITIWIPKKAQHTDDQKG